MCDKLSYVKKVIPTGKKKKKLYLLHNVCLFVYSRAEVEQRTATTSTLKLLLSYEQTLYHLTQSKTTCDLSRLLDIVAL